MNMKMTIRKKLYGGFSIILLILIIISIINFILNGKISRTYINLIDNRAKIVSDIKDLSIAIGHEQASVDHFLLTADPIYLKDYQNGFNQYKEKSEKISKNLKNDKENWQVFQGLNLLQYEFVIIADQMMDAKKQNKVEQYTKLASDQGPLIKKFSETADKLIDKQQKLLDKELIETKSTVNYIKIFIVVITLITLNLGLVIAFIISRSISTPIIALSNTATKIAAGDLTAEMIKVKSKDEVQDLVKSFFQMVYNLQLILQKVKVTAINVASAAEELTLGAKETTSATRHVASITQDVTNGTEGQVKNPNYSWNYIL